MEKEAARMIVVDTDVFVDYLRGHAPAVAFFRAILRDEDACFSTVTEAELLAGHANDDPAKREKMLHFIHCWNDVAPDHAIAVVAGDLRRKHDISLADCFIAASALVLRAELATRNIKDFQKIDGLAVRPPY